MVTQASRPVTLDGSAPDWAKRAFSDAEKGYVHAYPTSPVRVPSFTSDSLPNAASYTGCMIFVPDKQCASISIGSAWVRPDGSPL